MMTTSDAPPSDPEPEQERKVVSAAQLYAKVPALRRQDVCSKFLVAHVIAMFAIGYVPILFPIGSLTTFGVVLVCVMALSGPIYIRQLDFKTKLLEQWSTANKVAAVVILIVFIAAYGFLGYWLYFRR